MKSLENSPEVPKFQDVMSGMAKELNSTQKAPDLGYAKCYYRKWSRYSRCNVLAISKAELSSEYCNPTTTKVVQAYDKIMSIQV